MSTPIENRDLTQQAPHSPHERYGDYSILARTTDKCRASINGNKGEYHFDCPLDNQLFSFKGIKADQFKAAVEKAKTYEDVAKALENLGTHKSPEEIKAWSDKVDNLKLRDVPTMKDPARRKAVEASCQKLDLDVETVTLFDWLDADDEAGFEEHSEHSEMAHNE